MTPIRTKEAVLSPELIHEHWPFIDESGLYQISGRVDRLYVTLIGSGLSRSDAAVCASRISASVLIGSGLSRSDAAHQIHQVIRASQQETQSTPWAQKTWSYRHGEATCTTN